jgi:hypothetical protein
MKRFALLFVLPAITMACAGNPSQSSSVSGPTPVAAASTATDPYAFDATQLGRMTLTNSHTTSIDYTFIIWRYFSEENQVNKAQVSYRLRPGETRDLTVGVAEECDARYQRNVFVGIAGAPDTNPFTMSDLRNYTVYAPGAMWIEPACDAPIATPPPPPPPPTFCTAVLSVPTPCRR